MKHPLFPNSDKEEFEVTSFKDIRYNCIAWAVDDDKRWWEPSGIDGDYWPEGTRFDLSVECLIEAYTVFGYEECEDGAYEIEWSKIAIFSKDNIEYTHAAKQLDVNYWSSKLGDGIDIKHTLKSMQNGAYGKVVRFMKKRNDC